MFDGDDAVTRYDPCESKDDNDSTYSRCGKLMQPEGEERCTKFRLGVSGMVQDTKTCLLLQLQLCD